MSSLPPSNESTPSPSRSPSLRPPDSPKQQPTNFFFSHPVKYAVTSTLRRLQSDPASFIPSRQSNQHLSAEQPKENKSTTNSTSQSRSTSPSRRISTNNFASLISGLNQTPRPFASEQQIPPRRPSPFQPPPLTPLVLLGYNASTPPSAQLLGRLLAEEIRLLIPPRLQIVNEWRLLFSLEQDGASLPTLFLKCNEERTVGLSGSRGGYVLIVRDTAGGVSGPSLPFISRPVVMNTT